MVRLLVMVGFCALVIGAVRFAQENPNQSRSAYLACAERRVMTFGSGQRSLAIAEFAAIVRWIDKSAEVGDGFDNWALAQDRWLKCQRVGKSDFLQCRIAALPCRPKSDGA